MKKNLIVLRSEQKYGMLVYDEILLRERLSVNSQTLTYIYLCRIFNIFKSQPWLGFFIQQFKNCTQPITVFASVGPVKGITIKIFCLYRQSVVILTCLNFNNLLPVTLFCVLVCFKYLYHGNKKCKCVYFLYSYIDSI